MGLLECRNVRKRKGDFLLEGIDFSVDEGYVVGVIGRNGAGKTTLVRLLLGCYGVDKGEILLDGVSVLEDVKEYKRRLAFVLGETPFPVALSAADCGRLYAPFYEGFDLEKYRGLLKSYGVEEKKALRKLSQGQRVRQQLAFALSYEAKLYVFDEPGANLDGEFRELFYDCVRGLMKEGNRMVVYVSHLVDEMEHLADEILWVSGGRQRYFGTLDELREEYWLVEASQDWVRKFEQVEVVGVREREAHQEVLVRVRQSDVPRELRDCGRYASLKEIMYYSEKEDLLL